jgi:hypothetical protein
MSNELSATYDQKLERVEGFFLQMEQANFETRHHFAPGMYCREVTIPADTYAIGHYQNEHHLNHMLRGKVQMFHEDGTSTILEGEHVFWGAPGRKVGYIIEEVVWRNVYKTDETEVAKLEARFLTKSKTFTDREDYFLMLNELGITEEQVREQTCNKADQVRLLGGKYDFKLGESQIEGTGVFAVADAEIGHVFGPARLNGFRTQLGRYTNHSPNPNCEFFADGSAVSLRALREVKMDEELTVNYRDAHRLSQELEKTCPQSPPQL